LVECLDTHTRCVRCNDDLALCECRRVRVDWWNVVKPTSSAYDLSFGHNQTAGHRH